MNIWTEEPPFPASDLSPGEKRVQVGAYWVDCFEGENPTDRDIAAILNPPTPVPFEIDSVAIKTLMWETPMGNSTMLDAAEAIVATQLRPVQLFWLRDKWRRDDPTLVGLAKTAFQLTDQQIDAMFIQAKTKTAAG